ncbi:MULTISPECIES: alpha/beta hydrolase [Microbacterium]|uniref:Acetyl esterase n=1 Tax=Microbacterium saccharophilum TaxID=1213358 RepID=A0A7Z7D2R9_9MICO|nr:MULTISPECIES: alpha/beta hydrolase [Microbacterium]SFI61270.1 acetyl esterase [Microbacterium saccharophilum]
MRPLITAQRDITAGVDIDRLDEDGLRAIVQALRHGMRRPAAKLQTPARIEEIAPGGVPARLYRPVESDVRETLPVLIYAHGGGWIGGDLDLNDEICRALAADASCAVVSVDYRLAPEHPYPAALDDCWSILTWAHDTAPSWGGDPDCLAVAGSSAGGNLAAALAIRARDAGIPLRAQLLMYPVTDGASESASFRDYATGYTLTASQLRFFWRAYANPASQRRDPEVSPLHLDTAHGLAPALIITAELDPLRDEGEAYGRLLKESGVPVQISRYRGQLHGFVAMTDITPDARSALAEMAVYLIDRWGAAGHDRLRRASDGRPTAGKKTE